MPARVTIFRRGLGLNTRSDPVRLVLDLETGSCEFSQAYNVDVEVDGRVSRRKGATATSATTSAHSLFCDGGECLCVEGTSIKRVYRTKNNISTESITNGTVSAGRRLRCVQVLDIENNPKIYWCNGSEMGVYREKVNATWESAGAYTGPTTMKTYSDIGTIGTVKMPRVPHILEFYNGRIYMAVQDTLWFTRYMDFNKLDTHRNWIPMGDRITCVRAVSNGLYVGTTRQMVFLKGDAAPQFEWHYVDPFPVVEGSDVKDVDASDLRVEGLFGKGVVWTAHNGIWWGGPEGQVLNMTKDKIVMPSARYASAVYRDDKQQYVVLLEP